MISTLEFEKKHKENAHNIKYTSTRWPKMSCVMAFLGSLFYNTFSVTRYIVSMMGRSTFQSNGPTLITEMIHFSKTG
jgi:hypothetical protein